MAKKLYGAAAAARKKRLAKLRRKRKAKANPARKRKSTARRRKARKNPMPAKTRAGASAASRRRKRSAAAKKAAATRARKKAARSRAAKKAAATRKRRTSSTKRRRTTAPKRRKTTRRKMTAAQRRARKRAGGRKSAYGLKSVKKARRTIRATKRRRGRGGLAKRYMKRYRMKSNPGAMMDAVKQALPVAGSLYLSRLLSAKVAEIPAIGGIMAKLQVGRFNLARPVMAAGLVAAAHYGTKKGALKQYRPGIMIGTALNLIDSVVGTFAPDDVKGMFGLSNTFEQGMGDYVAINGYAHVDDYVTVDDYVAIDGIESELGLLESDLGVEAELGMGSFDDRRLGGVHRSSMLAPVPSAPSRAPVPARSYTRGVPHVSDTFDDDLYQGIFSGSGWQY